MGHMSAKMQALAESQDKIGWRNFTEGYISCHFYNIQHFHLSMSSSYLNGFDWTKMIITKILQITHSQMDTSKHLPPQQKARLLKE